MIARGERTLGTQAREGLTRPTHTAPATEQISCLARVFRQSSIAVVISLISVWRCAVKDAVLAYVKRVKDLHEKVKGNEQATKQSLIAPLFSNVLGYDLADPD